MVLSPVLKIFKIGKIISHKQVKRKIIGDHFVEIDDKLINLLQLNEMDEKENELITASIVQKQIKLNLYSSILLFAFQITKNTLNG